MGEITACGDVQEITGPPLSKCVVWSTETFIVLQIYFSVVGCRTTILSSFYVCKWMKNCSELFACRILNRLEFNWVLVHKSVSTSGGNCLHMFASPEFCLEFQIQTKLKAQRRTQPELPAQSDLGLELCKISIFSLVSNSYHKSLRRSQEVLSSSLYLPQVPLKYLAISKFSILSAKILGF